MKAIKPMTRQELESLPESAFPLELKRHSSLQSVGLQKIWVLSNKSDKRGFFSVLNEIGNYFSLDPKSLKHYPSLNQEQEPEKVMWYRVESLRKCEECPYSHGYMYKSKEHFLTAYNHKESDFHFIDLIPIGERPDYSEVK